MNKETERYSFVEYKGCSHRIVNNEEDYQKLLKVIRNHNDRKGQKYYFGNVRKKQYGDKYLVEFHAYTRLTERLTISEVLDIGKQYTSIKDICNRRFSDKITRTTPDVFISYFETKNSDIKKENDYDIGVKALPIIFEPDKKYLERSYVIDYLNDKAKEKDFKFFLELSNAFTQYKNVEGFSRTLKNYIYNTLDEKHNGKLYSTRPLAEHAKELYEALTVEKNKYGVERIDKDLRLLRSERRKLDFGLFLREYDGKKRVYADRFNVKQDPRYIKTTTLDEIEEIDLNKPKIMSKRK